MLPRRPHLRPFIERWTGPLIIYAAAVAGLIWSWGTWPDVLVDFGREMYVPWRLSQGQVLYRDIVSFNGPLSPYAIALWFSLFGVSLRSLVVFNAIFIAGVLCLLYQMFSQMAGKVAATGVCLTFLGAFAFAQLVVNGNYNWLCPYSHEITHGVGLSMLSIYFLFHFVRSPRLFWLAGSAVVLGLVFLTKAEVFAAALAAHATALAALAWMQGRGLRKVSTWVSVWLAAALLPATIAFVMLSAAMDAGEALQATLGTWPYVLDRQNIDFPFFKQGLGTLHVGDSALRIVESIAWYALLVVVAGRVALACGGRTRLIWTSAAIMFCLVGGVLMLSWLGLPRMIRWYDVAAPWQVLMVLLCVMFAGPIAARGIESAERPAAVLRLTMTVFSLVLLGKMILNVRIHHYGFALALPATLMVVAASWQWLPQILRRRGGQPVVFRAAVLAAWLFAIGAHVWVSNQHFTAKPYVVGAGTDGFRANWRGSYVDEGLKYLAEHAGSGDSLVVIPDGIMLNYLLRLPSSTPYVQYTPASMAFHGADQMLTCLARSPPDWIVLVHQDYASYGARFFGTDFGEPMMRWIGDHYRVAHVVGALPFRDAFGILIARRTSGLPLASH